jgi:hypothetical protein
VRQSNRKISVLACFQWLGDTSQCGVSGSLTRFRQHVDIRRNLSRLTLAHELGVPFITFVDPWFEGFQLGKILLDFLLRLDKGLSVLLIFIGIGVFR